MIRFCLNGVWRNEAQVEPSITILRYLRTSLGHTGTKEGCGSGDCGACTVMLGDFIDGSWQYQAVNSCITLLAGVHGRHLVTVEGLADESQPEGLHPMQQSMVDYHASQCGFCTPGFVMSLAALNERSDSAGLTEPQVIDAISGNLCRCTGYRPIVDAALNSHAAGACQPRYKSATGPDIGAAPAELKQHDGQHQQHLAQQHLVVMPDNERDLKAYLQQYPEAKIVAGGTDLVLQQTQNFQPLAQLIGINRVQELNRIDVKGARVTIGAAVTYSQIEQQLEQAFPAFIDLLHRLGSRQIRNQATLVGNIANASPIGDTPPFLLTLNAELTLASSSGDRRIALAEFFIDYKKTQLQAGEYIRQVAFELPGGHEFMRAYKISKRFEDDISALLMAVRWRIENGVFSHVQLAFGGMAATPKRAASAEQKLLGSIACEQTIVTAAKAINDDFTPISDVRASADYRLQVAKNLLLKAWLESQAQPVSVWQPTVTRRTQQIFGGYDAQR